MSDRLCIVMPVYNERDAIGGVLRKWTAMLDGLDADYAIRPYNDGSKDESLAVMRQAAVDLPRVEVRDKPNGGHGPTILQGYREAAADGFDWIFQIDSDDEMGPESFVELWSRRAEYDFLVGRRDGRRQALPRKIVSLVSRLAVRLFYGKGVVWDVNAPYRLMRVSALREVFGTIPHNTFAPNVIITGMVARLRLRACEMPVPQHDRTTGEVSIKKWKLLKAAAKSLCQTVCYSLEQNGGWKWFFLLALVAVVFRWRLMQLPPTYDFESYRIVGDIVEAGGNVYAETIRYNYGPIWFWILGFLKTSCGEHLRIAVVLFLSLVDVLLGALLWKRKCYIGALVFLLSYVIAYISGRHNQFDNLAVLFGLLSLVLLDEKRNGKRTFLVGAFLLGVSITIKHIFVFMPVWLLFRKTSWRNRLCGFFIPLIVFASSFVPYMGSHPVDEGALAVDVGTSAISDRSGRPLAERFDMEIKKRGLDVHDHPVLGIAHNVVLYQSHRREVQYAMLLPQVVRDHVPTMALFVGLVLLTGWLFRNHSHLESGFAYTLAIFVFSPAIADQYFAVPAVALAYCWWPFGLAYHACISASAFLNIEILGNEGATLWFWPVILFAYATCIGALTVLFLRRGKASSDVRFPQVPSSAITSATATARATSSSPDTQSATTTAPSAPSALAHPPGPRPIPATASTTPLEKSRWCLWL